MRFVNKAILSVIAAGTAIAVPTTANAFDYGDSITTSVHKVKFERAALKTPLKPLKQYHLMKGASVKSVSFMPR